MVVTSKILQDRLGISKKVADYFANERPVPSDNLFWKNKRIYLSIGFGYLTIPLAFDLMWKRGIPLDDLLEEQHVTRMEQGFDRLKRFEAKMITLPQFLQECSALLNGAIKQHALAEDLWRVFSGKPALTFTFESRNPSLARSDFFLFTLVDLPLNNEWVADFLPYWYALARPILLLDDFKDYPEDLEQGEENAILDLGGNQQAVEAAYALGRNDLSLLSTVNPLLATYLENFLSETQDYQHIKQLMLNR
jgi:hypothetical protein